MAKCREIMTPDPVCSLPADSVTKAAQYMKSENVGSIPVVDDQENKRLVGIITDRDLALGILADGRDAGKTTVKELMTTDPVSCKEDDNVEKALHAMQTHQVRRIPVVDKNQRLVGIIAQGDIATRLQNPEKTAEVVEEVSRP